MTITDMPSAQIITVELIFSTFEIFVADKHLKLKAILNKSIIKNLPLVPFWLN